MSRASDEALGASRGSVLRLSPGAPNTSRGRGRQQGRETCTRDSVVATDRQWLPESVPSPLPIALGFTGLSLLLAGTGQFVAALRSPRTYAVSLAFAVGAVVVIVAPIQGWQHLRVAVTSLTLAVASLIIAVVLPFGSRQTAGGTP